MYQLLLSKFQYLYQNPKTQNYLLTLMTKRLLSLKYTVKQSIGKIALIN